MEASAGLLAEGRKTRKGNVSALPSENAYKKQEEFLEHARTFVNRAEISF